MGSVSPYELISAPAADVVEDFVLSFHQLCIVRKIRIKARPINSPISTADQLSAMFHPEMTAPSGTNMDGNYSAL